MLTYFRVVFAVLCLTMTGLAASGEAEAGAEVLDPAAAAAEAVAADDAIPNGWSCRKYFAEKSEVNPAFRTPEDEHGRSDETLLFGCSGVAEAEFLLGLGVDAAATDSWGCNALFDCEDPDVVRLLVGAGADPHARTKSGRPVMHDVPNVAVARVLVEEYGVDPRGEWLLCGPGFETEDDEPTNIGNTIFASLCDQKLDLLRYVVSQDVDPNSYRQSPPTAGGPNSIPNAMFWLSCFEFNIKETKPEETSCERTLAFVRPALHVLKELGCDFTLRSDRGCTYLHHASSAEAVRFFVAEGLDVDGLCNVGRTPLQQVISRFDAVESFMGADVDKDALRELYKKTITELIFQGASTHGFSREGIFDDDEWAALQARMGRRAVVEDFLASAIRRRQAAAGAPAEAGVGDEAPPAVAPDAPVLEVDAVDEAPAGAAGEAAD